jgi:hypothetical protein
MRRVVVAVTLVVVAVSLMGASVASADPSPVCNGQPCVIGAWYTSPVSLTWNLNGDSNGGGCSPQNYVADTNQSYLQNEPMADWPAWTYCNDTTSGDLKHYFIEVEVSSPTASVAPNRGPDSNGWYNHPVAGAVSASSFSGIASCASTTYAGPNTGSATVSGTCTDNAGKTVAVTSAPFAYDATPPALTAAADPGDQTVALSWQAGGDVAPIASIQVTRSGGAKAAGVDTVYTGTGTGFNDRHLKNGEHYTYTITARDLAGNVTAKTITITPAARLLGPAPNAHITAPPMLSWTAAPSATYYNVQLFRGAGAKVLSLWPAQASVQLRRTWRFDGHRYRLKPGKYRWYVWPGLGRRKAGRYGQMIGSGTFVVVR